MSIAETISSLGENESLKRTIARLNISEHALVGPGDDSAVISAPDGRFVVTTDTLVEDHDFKLDWSSGYDLGWKAVASNIAVDAEWQGRGVATEMMLDLAFLAHDRGCEAMTLEVRHTNTAAQQLYRRFGFVPAGVRKRYYENTDDAIIMWAHGVNTSEFVDRLRLIESRRPV